MDLSTLLDDETLWKVREAYQNAAAESLHPNAILRGEPSSLGIEAMRQVLFAALAPLVERIATLEKENAELRTVFGLVEAERDGQAAGTLPDVKFYDDPVAFAREMTARIVVDRDNKKHALRKALERAEAAERARDEC